MVGGDRTSRECSCASPQTLEVMKMTCVNAVDTHDESQGFVFGHTGGIINWWHDWMWSGICWPGSGPTWAACEVKSTSVWEEIIPFTSPATVPANDLQIQTLHFNAKQQRFECSSPVFFTKIKIHRKYTWHFIYWVSRNIGFQYDVGKTGWQAYKSKHFPLWKTDTVYSPYTNHSEIIERLFFHLWA